MARTVFRTVDEYIASFPKEEQAVLQLVRRTIRRAVPGAEERISYQMPAYRSRSGPVIAFAGWKTHYALYGATKQVAAAFGKELAPYEVDRGTIRFPLSGAVPVRLIARIAKFRAARAPERAGTARPHRWR